MHKYPYRARDFVDNAIEYGIKPALQEDLHMTKDKWRNNLENITLKTLMVVGLAIAIPVIVYNSFKHAVPMIKESKNMYEGNKGGHK